MKLKTEARYTWKIAIPLKAMPPDNELADALASRGFYYRLDSDIAAYAEAREYVDEARKMFAKERKRRGIDGEVKVAIHIEHAHNENGLLAVFSNTAVKNS